MSTILQCDGCEEELTEKTTWAKVATRRIRWQGPDSAHLHGFEEKADMDLCKECAEAAFGSIKIHLETTTILGS